MHEDCPQTAPCIACGKALRDWSHGNNQPHDGLEFATRGHFPSSIFDGQPGELIVNICDGCLLAGAESGRVLHRDRSEPYKRGDRPTYAPWPGPRR